MCLSVSKGVHLALPPCSGHFEDTRLARSIRSASLETRTARLKLPVRKKSYFLTVARGIALGYRRNRNGAGTWSVRAGSGGDAWLKAFATADDHEDADGEHVLDFWQAQDYARSLARDD